MTYSYIYPSNLRARIRQLTKDIDYKIWQTEDVASLAGAVTKPIIEIGGPTQYGFYFLGDVELNSRPIITNITATPMRYSPDAEQLSKEVDQLVDGTNMPFASGSTGIFIMAAMSHTSDWWVGLPDKEKEAAQIEVEAELAASQLEVGQVALGVLDPKSVKNAQRIKIYLEVARCLETNGLFFTDGGVEEIAVLEEMGFEMIACLQVVEALDIRYEFVVVKKF